MGLLVMKRLNSCVKSSKKTMASANSAPLFSRSLRWAFHLFIYSLILTKDAYAQMAPSIIPKNRVDLLLAAFVNTARALRYQDLCTFDYLVNSHIGEWVFTQIDFVCRSRIHSQVRFFFPQILTDKQTY